MKNQVVKIPESWSSLNQANTWITGDLHIENLGFYGNRNGEAIFELNDFDEATIALFYFDLLNYGTSLYLLNDAAPNLQLEVELRLSNNMERIIEKQLSMLRMEP